ncbi:MAG: hypothetical protein AMJ43_07800 [Coxiella sp. DG_40]|nr:MAG: hypothetical protein AMJ43_07800 [Coxiella sp. DG_40]
MEKVTAKVIPWIIIGALGWIATTTTVNMKNINSLDTHVKVLNVSMENVVESTKKNDISIASLTDKFHNLSIKVAEGK